MVKSSENGTNIPPFLMKCYEMVDDQSTNLIISWSESNDSFVISDMTSFSTDLLPKYFKHRNFSSFMRQLNIYGFRKVDTDRWEFANEGFVRGQKHLLKTIKRRKNLPGSAQKNSQDSPPTELPNEVDYSNLQKQVETLKIDKNILTQELVELQERQGISQNKLILLRDRLQGMETNQQQMLSFLVMVIQSPGVLVQFFQPKESNWRMTDAGKITLRQGGAEDGSRVASDGMIVRYQPRPEEATPPPPPPPPPTLTPVSVSSEINAENELLFDNMDFLMNMDFPSEENFMSSENYGPIILPEPELDLSMLEQFLLSSPSRDGTEDALVDPDEP